MIAPRALFDWTRSSRGPILQIAVTELLDLKGPSAMSVRRVVRNALLAGCGFLAFEAGSARAQSIGVAPGPGSGSSVFVPYAGGFGGFVPYQSGPSGGLGVMGRTGPLRAGTGRMGLGMTAGRGSAGGFGMGRSTLSPLRPLGSVSGAGMGMSGLSAPRLPAGGMGGPERPPVGYYPFRVPPPLFGPAPAAAAMPM